MLLLLRVAPLPERTDDEFEFEEEEEEEFEEEPPPPPPGAPERGVCGD